MRAAVTTLLSGLRRFWSGSIRRRLTLAVALFTALVMALFGYSMGERQRVFLLQQSEERAVAVAETLAASSASWVLANDVVGLGEVLGAVRHYPDLRYVMVLAPDGRVLAHSQPGLVGRYASDATSTALLAAPAQPRLVAQTPALIDAAAPILAHGALVGWVRVGLGRERLQESLRDTARSGLLYGGVAIVLAVLLAAGLTRGLTQALDRLVEMTRRVGAGMADVRSGVRREDELGELADAFDRMTAALDEAARELKHSLDEVTDLYDHAPCGYHSVDPEGVLVRINDTELAWLGYRREEVLDKMKFEDLLTPASRATYAALFATFKQRGWVRDQEMELVRRDGSVLPVLINATAVRDEAGRFLFSRTTLFDITDRRRADEAVRALNLELERRVAERTAALERSNHELARANQELEAFSYSVSHDLRAPLRAIDGFSRILAEEYFALLDGEGRRYLDIVRSNAVRMGDLIDDILDFSRMSRREMALAPIDLAILIRQVFEEVRGAVPERKIELRLGELPPARGDRAMLRQVLVNLLSNAVKFSAPRVEAVIEVGGSAGQWEHTYWVKDNGVGFDMQYADKLFGAFQRLHGAEEFDGTGIGLAIVKRVVERHGGRVWAEGRLGEGATFFFTLPAG